MRTRRLVIVVLLCTISVGLWLLLRITPPGYTRIDLTEDGKGHILLSAVLPDGERVTLTWRNSQFGLDVTEAFFARSGVLVQDRVTFAAPDGAPPPRVSPKDVDDLFHTGGAFDARGLSRPFTRIVYRIGEIGNPKLQVQNRTISFKQEAGFGGRVILTASRPVVYEILYEDIGSLADHLGTALHHRLGLRTGAGRGGQWPQRIAETGRNAYGYSARQPDYRIPVGSRCCRSSDFVVSRRLYLYSGVAPDGGGREMCLSF